MEICNIGQYKFVPILFIVLILIPDFLNFYAVLHCVDVKSAQALSWSDSTTKEVISGASQLPTGWPADASKGTMGRLDGSTGGGVIWTAQWLDKGRRGLSRTGWEGIGWIDGLTGGGGGWTDQRLDKGKRGLDKPMVW
jgi:hypothetical protein